MGKVICSLLLVLALLGGQGVHAAAQQPPATQESTAQKEEPAPNRTKRLWLILGGTVVGVTGMWITLYKRGK